MVLWVCGFVIAGLDEEGLCYRCFCLVLVYVLGRRRRVRDGGREVGRGIWADGDMGRYLKEREGMMRWELSLAGWTR